MYVIRNLAFPPRRIEKHQTKLISVCVGTAAKGEMNETGSSDGNNATFAGNESVEQDGRFNNFSGEPSSDFTTTYVLYDVIVYVSLALGVPGNILSAIVWLRRHVASENPSATYLAALAINDLVFQIIDSLRPLNFVNDWLGQCALYTVWSTAILEALLVLSFSVLRLIAIRRPLQVCFVRFRYTRNYCRRGTAQYLFKFRLVTNNW